MPFKVTFNIFRLTPFNSKPRAEGDAIIGLELLQFNRTNHVFKVFQVIRFDDPEIVLSNFDFTEMRDRVSFGLDDAVERSA